MVSGPIQDESMPTRTSDWACVLEAAAQRRTEVLQPENLENIPKLKLKHKLKHKFSFYPPSIAFLLFGYTPVRSDSVVGELKLSEPTDVILLGITRIEMLAVTDTFGRSSEPAYSETALFPLEFLNKEAGN
ncbi:unnamed protein product [Lactuca virosa]|uniref:Uncharacterized protein n=1 Tax=Lactuca virosa TaxID=75947 RepID=A0AAU9NS57_9ASTR|nr:unnamed protein product [Lactuca virosa]